MSGSWAVARIWRPACVRERNCCSPPKITTATPSVSAPIAEIDSLPVICQLAVAIAAIAGMFLAIRSSFSPYAGPTNLIFAFEAVVIGGLGSSLWGALLGGIVLGVAQAIGGQINPEYSVLAGHLVFLLVLASPRGGLLTLVGVRRARRVAA